VIEALIVDGLMIKKQQIGFAKSTNKLPFLFKPTSLPKKKKKEEEQLEGARKCEELQPLKESYFAKFKNFKKKISKLRSGRTVWGVWKKKKKKKNCKA
jgi:hypothetical protein